MSKIIAITYNNYVIYGIITKDNINNIMYDVLATQHIYKNERNYINFNMPRHEIDNIINNKNNSVYIASKSRYNINKIKNNIISKNKIALV
jgi:hypothetical protein